jgi:hypothetical protein
MLQLSSRTAILSMLCICRSAGMMRGKWGSTGGKARFHTQTHSQLCHQESPSAMFEEEIIQVLMLNESAEDY